MQFQDACRVDHMDSAVSKNYLTKTRGFSLACEPSSYSIRLTSLEPFKHVQCFKHLYSPLHTAVLCGNVSTVRALMTPTGSLFHVRHHLITKHGTLLHSACVSGSKEMVEMMIREFNFGCDINDFGNTALHVACEWGWLEIVQYLCECSDYNVNINITNCNGYSPFTLAIKHNRFDIFKYLLTFRTVDVNVQSTDTLETPLHLACCCESPGYASALLDDNHYTTSLDAVDKYGDTPLFNACRVGSTEVIGKLIAKPECNCLYVNLITQETPAHILCRKNELDILKLILSKGIPNPFKDTQFNCLGKSLLHIACDNDSEEVVDFLIDNVISAEFNPNIPEVLMSPVHIACAHDNVKILRKLISSRICKISDKDTSGNNVFHYICTREQVSYEMMEVFSTNVVSKELIVQSNQEGKNPLHFVCENDAVQVLDSFTRQLSIMLEQVNAALCSTDNDGNTPFHTALIQKSTLVLRYLLNTPEVAGGISKALCTQDSSSCSPLHLVCYKLQVDYAQFIMSSPYLSKESIRVAVCLVDQEGNNIFHVIFAYYYNHEQLIQMFEVLMQLAGCKLNDDVFVQALCMHNKIRYTPLPYALHNRITDKMLCCILSLLVKSKRSIESVKTICSAPQTENGDTLLHLTARKNLFNCVKMLIDDQLCDPQKTNNCNQTSLHLACKDARYDFSQTTLFLCKHGCDVHQLDDHGHSPALYAFDNQVSLLKEMIAMGYCNPTKYVQSLQNLTDYCHIMGSYNTLTIQLPLPHLAVYRQRYESDEIMDFLLSQQDFSPIVFDSFENTFFHLKSFSYQLSNRLVAICNRDYLNKQNKERNTPLHLACATGNKQMMKFLIESEK